VLSCRAMDELDEIARIEIQEGWDVFDADGERIGEVAEVHDTAFTLETTVGGALDVNFTNVESADDGRVTLAMSGDELTSELGTET
jgi:hypothetical protein